MPDEPRVGVFICHCGTNIASTVDVENVAGHVRTLPGVAHVSTSKYACSDPGQKEIRQAIAEHQLNRIVVAACSPRMHEATFRACVAQAGLSPAVIEMANIREGCSWVHLREPAKATAKARALVGMAVAKARRLVPLEEHSFPVRQATLVIGGGIAGIQAALDIADSGRKVWLVERGPCLGGTMAQLNKTYPTMDCAI